MFILYRRYCAKHFACLISHRNPGKRYYWGFLCFWFLFLFFHCIGEKTEAQMQGEIPGSSLPPVIQSFSVASKWWNLAGSGWQDSQGNEVCRSQLLAVQSKAEESQRLDLRPNRMTDENLFWFHSPKECVLTLIALGPEISFRPEHGLLYLLMYMMYICESFLLWSIGSNSLLDKIQMWIVTPVKMASPMLCSMNHLFVSLFAFYGRTHAYGGSQARARIGAAAASLHHSHSNAGSVCDLHHSSQQHQILNPLREVTSQIRFHCTATGTPQWIITEWGMMYIQCLCFFRLEYTSLCGGYAKLQDRHLTFSWESISQCGKQL